MSDFAEKFERARSLPGDRARASRKKLLERRGAKQLSAERIIIDTMGGREEWRRVTGDEFEQEVRS